MFNKRKGGRTGGIRDGEGIAGRGAGAGIIEEARGIGGAGGG